MFRGTVIAQIIAVLIGIYLAKLYGQEAYGYFGFFISLISISSIVATLQLNKCIIISKDIKESTNWYSFILIIIPICTIIFFFLLYIFSSVMPIEKLSKTMFLLSFLGAILITYNLTHQSFFTYTKRFTLLSNTKIFLALCGVFFQYILYKHYTIFGLIIGFLISQAILFIYNFFINKKHITSINLTQIKEGIKSNSALIKYLLPSNIINTVANNVMPILILTYFGAEKAGLYFFSVKILNTPLYLISSSISDVYFKESSDLIGKRKKKLYLITKKIITTNLLIMLFFILFINTVGTYLLNIYFENKWTNLQLFTLILSFLILAKSSFNPVSSLIVVLNKNLVGLIFNCYLFAVNLAAIYIGVTYDNILYTVYILSIFGGLGYCILLTYFLNQLKSN